MGGHTAGLRARIAELEREVAELRRRGVSQRGWLHADRLLHEVTDHVLEISADGTILAIDRLHDGRRREDVVGSDICAYVGDEQAGMMRTGIERVLAGRGPQQFLLSVRIPDGREITYATHVVGVVEGGASRLFVVARNVDAEVTAELELRESERYFRDLTTLLPILVYRADRDGVTRYVNDQGAALSGQSSQKSLGAGWLGAAHPEDRDWLQGSWQATVAAGTTFEAEHRVQHVDGSVRWVLNRAVPEFDHERNVVGWLGSVTDITTQKMTEARLEEAQRIAQLGYWEWDLVTNDLIWSDEVYRIFGVSPGDFGAKFASFFELVHPDDRAEVDRAVRAVRDENAPPYDIDYRIVRPSGEQRIVHAAGVVTLDDRGAAIRMLGTVQDITKKRLLQRELDHRVKNNLAVVISLARQCLGTAADLESFGAAFVGRIMAMARAHEALAATAWDGLAVKRAVELILLAPLGAAAGRVALVGDDAWLPREQVTPFCMTVHELTSNALKYGALSNGDGRVELAWSATGEWLRCAWRESGGPPVTASAAAGMGTRLMKSFVEHEMGGELALALEPHGLECTMEIPLRRQADLP